MESSRLTFACGRSQVWRAGQLRRSSVRGSSIVTLIPRLIGVTHPFSRSQCQRSWKVKDLFKFLRDDQGNFLSLNRPLLRSSVPYRRSVPCLHNRHRCRLKCQVQQFSAQHAHQLQQAQNVMNRNRNQNLKSRDSPGRRRMSGVPEVEVECEEETDQHRGQHVLQHVQRVQSTSDARTNSTRVKARGRAAADLRTCTWMRWSWCRVRTRSATGFGRHFENRSNLRAGCGRSARSIAMITIVMSPLDRRPSQVTAGWWLRHLGVIMSRSVGNKRRSRKQAAFKCLFWDVTTNAKLFELSGCFTFCQVDQFPPDHQCQ